MEPESATFSGVKPLSAIGPIAVMSISLLKKAPTTWLIWFTFSSSVMSARSSFNFCSVIFSPPYLVFAVSASSETPKMSEKYRFSVFF